MITPKDIENKTMSLKRESLQKMTISLFMLEGPCLIS